MPRQAQKGDVADGIVLSARYLDAADGEEQVRMALLLPAVLGVVVHVVYHGTQLASAAQDGLVVVLLKQGMASEHAGATYRQRGLSVAMGSGWQGGGRRGGGLWCRRWSCDRT